MNYTWVVKRKQSLKEDVGPCVLAIPDITASSYSDESTKEVAGFPLQKIGVCNVAMFTNMLFRRRNNFIQKDEITCTDSNIPGKSVLYISCSCRLKCTDMLSFDDKQLFIKSVYDGCPKNEQDSFFMGSRRIQCANEPIAKSF